MVRQFDINKIIEFYKLNVEEVARVLFPTVKYQKAALDRILKGEASLDTDQVEALADYIGVFSFELFSSDNWKGSSENGVLTLLKGPYKVRLAYNNVFISIYKDDKLIYQKLANTPDMTMREFIKYIDNIIKLFENGKL